MVKSGTKAFSNVRTKNRSVCSAIAIASFFLELAAAVSKPHTMRQPTAASTMKSNNA